MKKTAISILAIGLSVVLVSFVINSRQKKSPRAYVGWVEDQRNGLNVSVEEGDLHYSLQYMPHDYQVAKTHRSDKLKSSALSKGKEDLKGSQYYRFRVRSLDGKVNIFDYRIKEAKEKEKRLEYLSFYAHKDFRLVDGQDTLTCRLHQLQRAIGVTPHCEMVLVFDENPSNRKTDKLLLYEDKAFGGGEIQLKIDAQDQEDIPLMITY